MDDDTFEYNVGYIKDEQEYSLVEIFEKLVTSVNKHLYYYGKKINIICNDNGGLYDTF